MAVVFEVSGQMAMFRKPYTTTSSISFAFPPPTAIAGLISGIVGISNGSEDDSCNAKYWEALSGTKVSVALLSNISWMWHAINFWNVKQPQKSPHIQVKHQFVIKPKYRIFVDGEIEDKLRYMLEGNCFKFTPYLGTAYAIADVIYIGQFRSEPLVDDVVAVDSVVPWNEKVRVLNILDIGGAFKEEMPFKMDTTRKLVESIEVLYAPSPQKKLLIKKGAGDVTKCGNDMVAWFPRW